METRLRASPGQFSVLLRFMESHGDFSKPQPGVYNRFRVEQLWKELSASLNSVEGGVIKSTDKWKKVWADWKTNTKRKCLTKRDLTPMEQRVVAMIGMPCKVVIKTQESEKISNETPVIIKEEGNKQEFNVEVVQCELPIEGPLSPSSVSQPEPVSPEPAQPQDPLRTRKSSPRRSIQRPILRRMHRVIPLDRLTSDYVGLEYRRLEFEEARDQRLHDREVERLRIESQRISVAQQHNQLLRQLVQLAQRLVDVVGKGTSPTFDND